MVGQWITTAGLACDVLGAWLVAIEVVRVFRGPTTIAIGDTGTIDGGFIPAPNPEYQKSERRRRYIMSRGLFFLTIGFLLQGLGTWWPSLTTP